MSFDFKMKTTNLCHERKFQWIIENFSKLPNVFDSIPFSPIKGYSTEWLLRLDLSTRGIFQVQIQCLDSEEISPPIKATGNMFLKNSSNALLLKKHFKLSVKPNELDNCIIFYYDEELLKPLNDVVIVECCMTVSRPATFVISPHDIKIKDISPVQNEEDILKTIYKRNVLTDVSFHLGNSVIRAHKVILSAISPVFEKIFKHVTPEQQSHDVTIENIDFHVFDCFIEFLYTREIREDVKASLDAMLALYEVTDQYGVRQLQTVCANILLSDFLDVNNFCKILRIADKHKDSSFKKAVMDIPLKKFLEVFKTVEWSRLSNECVNLNAEVITFMSMRNKILFSSTLDVLLDH